MSTTPPELKKSESSSGDEIQKLKVEIDMIFMRMSFFIQKAADDDDAVKQQILDEFAAQVSDGFNRTSEELGLDVDEEDEEDDIEELEDEVTTMSVTGSSYTPYGTRLENVATQEKYCSRSCVVCRRSIESSPPSHTKCFSCFSKL